VEEGTSVDGGVAVERKAGNYRLSGNVIMRWQSSPYETATSGSETDVTLVVAADRSFARETRNVRVFGVYTPDERNLFLRTIASLSLRDNLSLEGSVGWFAGEGPDAIGRFSARDFVYGRLKLHF
jgi:hypothetical protein